MSAQGTCSCYAYYSQPHCNSVHAWAGVHAIVDHKYFGVINPRRMHKGYGRVMEVVLCVCVCVCVCVWVCLLPDYLLHTSFTSLKCIIEWFLVMFKRYASIRFCWKRFVLQFCLIRFHPLPSTLPDEFSMDMMSISGIFSKYNVCSFSNSLYKTTANKIFRELTGKLLDLGRPVVGDMITCDHSGI